MATKRNTKNEELDGSFLDEDSNALPPNDIIAYNELRSCADLYRMYKDKVLDIDPDFQRGEVWPEAQKTRFIDSLIKKMPIPSLCFSLDYNTEKWEVIDGLQRITSIIKFLDDKDWRLSKLDDVDEKLSGKLVSEIKLIDNGILYTRLTNLTIPVTVLRCDYKKASHTNYLFTIFHRLNTGGIKLTNQEIRNAIYNGHLNTQLKDLSNNNSEWRKIVGLKENETKRLSKVELILRFFSFFDNLSDYNGKLSKFLNDYMNLHKNPTPNWIETKEKLFNETVSIIYHKIGDKKSAGLSNVYIEAILYGIGKNLNFLKNKNGAEVKGYLEKLKKNEHFSDEKLSEGLSSKSKVNNRLSAAKKIFSGK